MSPEISILLPRVLDNIRLAASPGNASVASLPRASLRDGKWQAPHLWQELGGPVRNVYFEQHEVTGAGFLLLSLNESADVFHGIAQDVRRRREHSLPSRLEHRELVIAGPTARFEHVVRFRRIQRDRDVGAFHSEVL